MVKRRVERRVAGREVVGEGGKKGAMPEPGGLKLLTGSV